jgi:hypothetical protein
MKNMNKKEIIKELKNTWHLFNMNDKEILQAYYQITGLDIFENQTILDIKKYLLEYVLDNIVKDNDATPETTNNVYNDIIKIWEKGGQL